jgi:RNA polymerase sigma factor (sigma-70 family)
VYKRQFLSLETLFADQGFDVPDDTDLQEEYIKVQEQLELYQDFRIIQELLRELPIKYQEVIALRFFENKKINEISQITGRNVNTVKSLLFRGLAKLRKQFAENKTITELPVLEMQPNPTDGV